MADPAAADQSAPAPPAGGEAADPKKQGRRRRQMSEPVKYARLSSLTAITFAVLFFLALLFVHASPSLSDPDSVFSAFYTGSSTNLVTAGLYLVPYAGIAFLWHMNATRLLVKSLTPIPSPIPYGLQLLSGVIFIALLFAGTAAAGSVALVKDLMQAPLPSVDVSRGLLGVGYAMVFVYAVRGAGMYALTTTTLLRNARILPTWLAIIGYVLAAFLLVTTTSNPIVMLLLPIWAVLVGLVTLIRSGRLAAPAPSEPTSNQEVSA